MSDHIHIAKASLRSHEGLSLKMYQCTEGYNTIGYGFNLDANPIPHEVADILLDLKVGESVTDCATFSYWHALSERRKAALIDMRYCLGPSGYRQFRKMHGALTLRNYDMAAEEILDSKFAKQTGRRATDLATMMEQG
jgi:lysozyme